jgi:hypothetical protein
MGSYAHVCATPEHHARAVGPGRSLQAMYATYMRESAQGDYTGLPALHAAAAGLKAHCSAMAADGIERARLLCGGHGYLASAGFATLFTNYVPQRCGALPLACVDGWPRWWGLTGGGLDEGGTAGSTYEGENTVMYLQAGRYLVKAYQAAADGQPLAKEVDYLKTPAATATRWAVPPPGADLDVPVLLAALRHRARVVVAVAGRAVAVSVAAGTAFPDAVNAHGVAVVDAAKAHWYAPPSLFAPQATHTDPPRLTVSCPPVYSDFLLARQLADAVEQGRAAVPPAVAAALGRLARLFSLSLLEAGTTALLEDGFWGVEHPARVRSEARALLTALRYDTAR